MAFAVRRIHPEGLFLDASEVVPPDLFAPPLIDVRTQQADARAILVDDPGHDADVARLVEESIAAQFSPNALEEIVRALSGGRSATIREFIASSFFRRHLSQYSDYRRDAPVYWQLATPSTSFSAWLYVHALTKDTLYKLQNDFVAHKLAYEERALESIRIEYNERPTGTERKKLTAQESLVEELRTFLDEIRACSSSLEPNI